VFASNYIRSLIVIILIALFFISKVHKIIFSTSISTSWYIVWAIVAAIPMFLSFIAFNKLSIWTSYFLIYACMTSGGFFLSSILYKEKITLIKIISLSLSTLGLLIIFRFEISRNEYIYALGALLSGLLTGFWNVLSKKFSRKYTSIELTLFTGITIFIISIMGAIIFKEPLPTNASTKQIIVLIIYSFSQILAIIFLIKGFKLLEGQIGSLLMPI